MNPVSRLKSLEWAMFIRHPDYDRITETLTDESDKGINAFARKIKPHLLGDKQDSQVAIFHSWELRSFETATALAWHLYEYKDRLPVFGLSCLSKTDYEDGVGQMNTVIDFLPDGVRGVIITNHNKAIPGIVGAFYHLITGEVIVCDVPDYGEGYLMDVASGEITIGLQSHFARLDAAKKTNEEAKSRDLFGEDPGF